MSIHFVTFVCALADSNEQVKKIALLILDMYRNYESFNKVLKGYKAEKEVDWEGFRVKKRKVHKIKYEQILDKLEDVIDDIEENSTEQQVIESKYSLKLTLINRNGKNVWLLFKCNFKC